MRFHQRVLACLFILTGLACCVPGLLLLAASMLPAVAGLFTGSLHDFLAAGAVSGFLGTLALIAVIPAMLQILVGLGMLVRKSWSRIGCVVFSILMLPAFPIGTGLGFYGFWICFSDEAPRLFDR